MTDPGTAVKVHLERDGSIYVPTVLVAYEGEGPDSVRYEYRRAKHLARPDESSGRAAARGLAARIGVPCSV